MLEHFQTKHQFILPWKFIIHHQILKIILPELRLRRLLKCSLTVIMIWKYLLMNCHQIPPVILNQSMHHPRLMKNHKCFLNNTNFIPNHTQKNLRYFTNFLFSSFAFLLFFFFKKFLFFFFHFLSISGISEQYLSSSSFIVVLNELNSVNKIL